MLLRRKNNILFLKNFEEIKNATLPITNKDMHVFPGSPKDIDCIYSILWLIVEEEQVAAVLE